MSKRGALHCKYHATGKQKINWPLKEIKLALENCFILLKYHQYEESICNLFHQCRCCFLGLFVVDRWFYVLGLLQHKGLEFVLWPGLKHDRMKIC